jgi:hypothetical protein
MFKVLTSLLKKFELADSTLDLEKKSDFAKFEVWEMLTFLTLVFTMGSIIVWFSSFYPQYNQQEFLFIDKQKSKISNSITKIDLKLQNQPALLQAKNITATQEIIDAKLDSELKTFFVEKDTVKWQENLDKIKQEQDLLKQIEIDTRSHLSFLSGSDYLIKTVDAYQDYLSIKEQEYRFNKEVSSQILELRYAFSLIISDNSKDLEKGLTSLKKAYKEPKFNSYFKNTEIFDKTKQTLDIFKKSPANNFEEIKNLPQNKQILEENFAYFIAITENDVQPAFNLNEVKTRQELFKNLKILEDWQKEFLESHPSLEEKTVWI